MITQSQIDDLRLRCPSLPSIITDDQIRIQLEDSELEFPYFGIDISDPAYNKMLTLYALHTMTNSGLISQVSSESVKDVSASYNVSGLKDGETVYYQEFIRLLRRRKVPNFLLFNT